MLFSIKLETQAQIKELAKLYFDIGKFLLLSLVIEILLKDTTPFSAQIGVSVFGLTIAVAFFTMGLQLLKKVR